MEIFQSLYFGFTNTVMDNPFDWWATKQDQRVARAGAHGCFNMILLPPQAAHVSSLPCWPSASRKTSSPCVVSSPAETTPLALWPCCLRRKCWMRGNFRSHLQVTHGQAESSWLRSSVSANHLKVRHKVMLKCAATCPFRLGQASTSSTCPTPMTSGPWTLPSSQRRLRRRLTR